MIALCTYPTPDEQFDKLGLYPDVAIGPCGDGSSFGGIAFPFLADKAAEGRRAANLYAVAVESTSCPSLTKGRYAYDFGDVSGYTLLMKMFTLGHDFMPSGIHTNGLRYRGASPQASHIDEARVADVAGEQRVILFNLAGHGFFDRASYDCFFAGQLENFAYPAGVIADSLQPLPKVG
jgi:tryptophan synthase beta chain